MRLNLDELCGCFPTGRYYPGIAERMRMLPQETIEGLAEEFDAHAAWVDLPFAVIDFETTGLHAEKDRVLEMGIVLFSQGELEAHHNFLIHPGMPVPEEARAVHGIGDDELKDAPRFEALVPTLWELLRGRIAVAYNAQFDRGFLYAELKRAGLGSERDLPPAFRPDVHWIDPLVWVRELQKFERSKKLSDVCARLGIPLDRAHRAASDAEATGKVLLALAPQMPKSYAEVMRLQLRYSQQQEAELARWRARRNKS